MKTWMGCLALLICYSFALNGEEDFSASISLSSDKLAINQLLAVKVKLNFPPDYHPNINYLQSNLLAYDGMNEIPYRLQQRIIGSIHQFGNLSTQTAEFILSPQLPGKHFLTFQTIRFDSNTSEKSVDIPSDVFTFEVTIPDSPFQLQSALSAPLPLTQELLITISQENQRKYLDAPPDNTRNLALLESRQFPWASVLAAAAVVIGIILIRTSGPIAEQEEEQDEEGLRKETLEELQKLVAMSTRQEGATSLVLQIDHALRNYLDTTYHLGAIASTPQEIMEKTAKVFDESLRNRLVDLFKKTDDIKFARRKASDEDYEAAIKTVSDLVKQSGPD